MDTPDPSVTSGDAAPTDLRPAPEPTPTPEAPAAATEVIATAAVEAQVHPIGTEAEATTDPEHPPIASGPQAQPAMPEPKAESTDARPQGFDAFGLVGPVREALRALGYEVPTPIQAECIPHILAGRDILGQAQTGTGKTAAFAVPLVNRIDLTLSDPQVLVLTPTRELALQVAEAFHSYGRLLDGFMVLPLYGGQSFGTQIRQLQRGAHVIVGTPGRVMDHMRQGYLNLEGIRTLVLDEADEMLNMGFAEDIDWIFDQAPEGRQVALFSATMPAAIRKVAQAHLIDPVEVKVASKTATVDTIEQRHCVVTGYHKIDVLTRVLEVEPFDAMLVFVRTKNATLEVAEKLTAHGFSAEALNGDMTQEARERTITRLKSGRLDILVATDVAARGLDVERISHVVNYDIPTDPEAYVHRVGRTGRAGREGRALLFVQPRERNLLSAIERTIRQRIPPMDPPSAAQVTEHRIDRLIALLRSTKAEEDLDFFYALVGRIEQEQEMSLLDIAATLTYLMQRERPLAMRDEPRQAGGERERPVGERRYEDRPPRDRNQGARPQGDRPQTERPYRPRERDGARDARPTGAPRDRLYGDQRHDQRPAWTQQQQPGQYAHEDRPARDERPPFRSRDGEAGRGFRDQRQGPTHDQRPAWTQQQQPGQYAREDRPARDDRPPFRPDRPERSDFRPRDDRPRREEGPRGPRPDSVPMEHFRIDVGRRDGVTPREIVGAIANEGGLDGRHIGRIDIQDDHCTLDLPAGMPREVKEHLRKVWVCGRPLNLAPAEGGPRVDRPSGDRPRSAERPRGDRPRADRPPRSDRPTGGDRPTGADQPPRPARKPRLG
jgi:ATP-dependent RNA helicase DeaD